MVARCLLISVVALFAVSMLVDSSHARIDPESVVGIWLLDEGQGDVVEDISGNGNHGEIVGATWTDGKFGKGLLFEGGSYVAIPASETIDDYMDGFTYLIWVKPTGPPADSSYTRVIERDWHNPTIQIGAADFYASICRNADQAATNIRGGTWEMGEWSFVAITHDGAILKLYVDGEKVNEKDVGEPDAVSHCASPANQGAIWLAKWKEAAGWEFTGVLDEVGVFNAPLSDEDIRYIMNNGLEGVAAVSALGRLASTWGQIKASR
jgi:hypothetical protein